jgi:hypothetical protein
MAVTIRITDPDGREPVVHGRQQIRQCVPEGALPMAPALAREQRRL